MTHCGGFNKNSFHRRTGSGTITPNSVTCWSRYDLVGGHGHCGAGFVVQMLKLCPVFHSLPAAFGSDVELSATSLALYMPVCHHASHDDNGLKL